MELKRRLLRRPRPYHDESLAGYIIRLTEANYYSSTNRIFQMSKLRRRAIYANVFHPKQDDLSELSFLCDVPESVLWSMAFPVVNQNPHRRRQMVKVFGDVVSIQALEDLWVKLCPLCLQAEPYYRRLWNLLVVTTCPVHHCLLIHICPACQLPIDWFRNSIVKCSCQEDWRYEGPPNSSRDAGVLEHHCFEQGAYTAHSRHTDGNRVV